METLFFILFLLIIIGLCIRAVIPKKDGTVYTGAGPHAIIHVKKQKVKYILWFILNLLIIILLATIMWLVLQDKTTADSPEAAHIIAIILFSFLCNVFLNALLGTIYELKQLNTRKKERNSKTFGKLVLFTSGTAFLGYYVFNILNILLNG